VAHLFFVDALCALQRKTADLSLEGPVRLVLDNARYQHCVLAMDLVKSQNIELLFLPSYSPNLNLKERLWRFIKKKALYARHYDTFEAFRGGIDGCLSKIETEPREELQYPNDAQVLDLPGCFILDRVMYNSQVGIRRPGDDGKSV
jgi:transposase